MIVPAIENGGFHWGMLRRSALAVGEKLGEIFPPNYFQECMFFLMVL